jgi:hypothetical protein
LPGKTKLAENYIYISSTFHLIKVEHAIARRIERFNIKILVINTFLLRRGIEYLKINYWVLPP